MTGFDPERLLVTLARHGVDFVVVGATAAWLQGNPTVTLDLDIAPRKDVDNAERLAYALNQLRARSPGAAIGDDAQPLDQRLFLGWRPIRFVTDAGPVDIVPDTAAAGDYTDLAPGAVHLRLGDIDVLVASLDAVIASKEFLDRAKDRAMLPVLYATRARLQEHEHRNGE